jgi:hypothetical protein
VYLTATVVWSLYVPRIDTGASCVQPSGSTSGLGGVSLRRYALCRPSVMGGGIVIGA